MKKSIANRSVNYSHDFCVKSGPALIKAKAGICLDASQRTTKGGKVHMWNCDMNNKNQMWKYDPSTGLIRNPHGICLDASQRGSNGGKVHMWTCDSKNPNQQWVYNQKMGQIKNRHGICLDASERMKDGGKVHMWGCDPKNKNQMWMIKPIASHREVDCNKGRQTCTCPSGWRKELHNVPTANGCGGTDWPREVVAFLSGSLGKEAAKCCAQHDICYGTNKSWNGCDVELRDCIFKAGRRRRRRLFGFRAPRVRARRSWDDSTKWVGDTAKKVGDGVVDTTKHVVNGVQSIGASAAAPAMYAAVRTSKGWEAYSSTQRRVFQCEK